MASHDETASNEQKDPSRYDGSVGGSPEEDMGLINSLEKNKFYDALYSHMRVEEVRFKVNSDRMAAIETDLRPIRSMYWAVIGSSGIATLLLATLVFIYAGDQADSKSMQQTLSIQGTAIEKLIEKYHYSEKDMDKMEFRLRILENHGVKVAP